MIFTLQFGTYTFPNQTFQIKGHPLLIDTPVQDVRRRNGGIALDGWLTQKKYNINGKLYGDNVDSVHNALNVLMKAAHNKGQAAYFQYRSDRRVLARLAAEGVDSQYTTGLYEHLMDVRIGLVSEKPFAESTTARTSTGTRTNNSTTQNINNLGNYPTGPIFTFVGGTWAFNNDIYVLNNANCLAFRFQGPLAAGQTLVVDCEAGCVLMHVGAIMVDAISYFSGDLDFVLDGGGTNTLIIDAATLSYSIVSRDRWYV